MALPWLRILNLVLTVTDVARNANRRSIAAALGDPEGTLAPASRGAGTEAGLARVAVAALKEAFNRDHQRLVFEREQMEAERKRADRLLKMELARQAGDRELARLRILSAIAIVSLLATLVVAALAGAGGTGTRVALGGGWLCLLAAVATAFGGQAAVSTAMAGFGDRHDEPHVPSSGPAGAATLWLVLAGVAVMAFAVLLH